MVHPDENCQNKNHLCTRITAILYANPLHSISNGKTYNRYIQVMTFIRIIKDLYREKLNSENFKSTHYHIGISI